MSSSKCAVSSSIKTSKAYKAYKWLSSIDFSEEYFTTTSRRHFSFLGSSILSWRDSPGSTNIFRENEKKMFYLGQVSTGHYEKYFNIFLRSFLVRPPCKPHFCSLHELHVLCISRDKINPHWAWIPRGEPGPHRWEARALPLTPFMLPNKICCFRSRFCSDSAVKTILSASVSDTLTEMRSFRPKVDSPNGVRQDIGRFAQWHTTLLQHGENAFRGVILVTLGFHMCSHCLSMHIPFFQA